MPPHPPRAAAVDSAVEDLLRALGPQLQRGGPPEEPQPRFPTGLAEIDRLLGGGFPRGRLSEVTGAASSGRTSLALALLARTTGAGEVCAVVDAADGFDPAAAEAAGVALDRVLWARAPDLQSALRATSRLLETEGFGLVLLDITRTARTQGLRPRYERKPKARSEPQASEVEQRASEVYSWSRLGREAAASSAALVVLGLGRTTGTNAEIALEMRVTRICFTGTPPLLETLETEARLLRHRTAPADRCARVRLKASEAA